MDTLEAFRRLIVLGCSARDGRTATVVEEAGGVCRVSLTRVSGFFVFTVVFGLETREERTGGLALPLCASFELSEVFLLGLFDGDTDDLHGWRIAIAWITWRDGH